MEKKNILSAQRSRRFRFLGDGSAGFYVPVCAGSLYHPVAHFFFSRFIDSPSR